MIDNLQGVIAQAAGAPPPVAPVDPAAPPPGAEEKMMPREAPEVAPARAALVKKWQKAVAAGKAKRLKAFSRMREDQAFADGAQWGPDMDDDRYVANIVQRHIADRVAALYAKNPRCVARRRQKLDFAEWDERPQSFQQALQGAQMGDPASIQLIQDVLNGMQQRQLQYRIAKTLELLFGYAIGEQEPTFKGEMKQLVRRAIVNGVAYVKLCYMRETERRPEVAAEMATLEEKLGLIDRINADVADGELQDDAAELEQMRLTLKSLHEEPEQLKHEGVFFNFPLSTAIIPDPKCRNLKGWVGADWVAEEFMLSVDRVKEIYGLDLAAGCKYTPYFENPNGDTQVRSIGAEKSDRDRSEDLVCVWEIYSKKDGLVYAVADGYQDFLREPDAPTVKLPRFYPWWALSFNEIENEREIFPKSDVRLLRPMQKEYNRSRQGLREHRHANRPKYATRQGALSDDDKDKLGAHPANAILELQGLQPGQKVDDLLQAMKPAGIDPAAYDTSYVFDDIQRVVGTQQANLGGTGGDTATEVSVAETSRMSGIQASVDELDDLLTELARATGHVMLYEYSTDTVFPDRRPRRRVGRALPRGRLQGSDARDGDGFERPPQ
jgi:hypothetical protein